MPARKRGDGQTGRRADGKNDKSSPSRLPVTSSARLVSGVAEIAYETAGTGYPLVLVHAGVADLRMWDDQISAFAAEYRTVRYDLRGFGGSTLPPDAFAPHADLLALLDGLGIARAHLVGVSFGGAIVLDFTLAYPDRVSALVLCGATPNGIPATDDIRTGWTEVDALLEAGDIDAAIELELKMWVDGPVRAPTQVDPAVRERVREMESRIFARAATEPEPETLTLDPPAAGRLAEIAVPTLVLVGDLDYPQKVEIAGQLAAGIPDARLEGLPGTAHLPNMEAPARFNRLVLDFLRHVGPRG